ncbi:hypothetical protein PENTCL1PPCAC_4257, partial [Pristionchus entomophagus]
TSSLLIATFSFFELFSTATLILLLNSKAVPDDNALSTSVSIIKMGAKTPASSKNTCNMSSSAKESSKTKVMHLLGSRKCIPTYAKLARKIAMNAIERLFMKESAMWPDQRCLPTVQIPGVWPDVF